LMGYPLFLIRLFDGRIKTPSNNLNVIEGGCLLIFEENNRATNPMCHAFLNDSNFYHLLFQIDQSIAVEEQKAGCSCGGVLHSANYPRKPRGVFSALDDSYAWRLSFCCAEDGCRRCRTPPSVRFLGRKVYLSVIVVLATAAASWFDRKTASAADKLCTLGPERRGADRSPFPERIVFTLSSSKFS
jgi:hypothetical protein